MRSRMVEEDETKRVLEPEEDGDEDDEDDNDEDDDDDMSEYGGDGEDRVDAEEMAAEAAEEELEDVVSFLRNQRDMTYRGVDAPPLDELIQMLERGEHRR